MSGFSEGVTEAGIRPPQSLDGLNPQSVSHHSHNPNGIGKVNRTAPKRRVEGVGPQGHFAASGQDARMLAALVTAGDAGRTALDIASWAFRAAAYVHRLRGHGLVIETVMERHPGGHHARYVLRSPVTVTADSDGRAAA